MSEYNKARRFAMRMDICHLMDLGCCVSKFTWRVRIINRYGRLDRGLCNDE